MDLDHKAAEDLVKMAAWAEGSLGYTREHAQRKLVWLLEAVRAEVKLEEALLALPLGEHLSPERGSAQGKDLYKKQRVSGMATTVLRRQAGARAEQTGEPFAEAFKAVLETKAGRQLGELRDGAHRNERAERWQEDLQQKRAEERKRA